MQKYFFLFGWIATCSPILVSAQFGAEPLTILEKEAAWSAKSPNTRFRFDLINLVRVIEPTAFRGLAYTGVERRVGTAYSFFTEAGFSYRLDAGGSFPRLQFPSRSVGLHFALRHYHQLKKQIRSELPMEAFFGPYYALAVQTAISAPPVSPNMDPGPLLWRPQFIGIGPMYGLQRTTVEVGFVDVNVGVLFAFGEADPLQYLFGPPANRYPRFRVTPVSNIRIGLKR